MNAWLITWEGTSGPAPVSDKKIVAIISGRRSSKAIREMVDLLYCRSVHSAYDMALFLNKRRLREQQYWHVCSQPDRFFYGHNPFIFARIVSNFRVEQDEARRLERVQWTEPPYLQIEKPGALPVEIEPAVERELIRTLRPLSPDIYEHDS